MKTKHKNTVCPVCKGPLREHKGRMYCLECGWSGIAPSSGFVRILIYSLLVCSLALLILLVSCTPTQEYDFFQKRIIDKLSETEPHLDSFVFTEYAVIDTVSLGNAIDDCIALHRKKSELAANNAGKFRKHHKRRNAAAYDSVTCVANHVCDKLATIKDSSSSGLNEPLYYCVRFSGQTFGHGQHFRIDGYYATIDPKGNIYNFQNNAGGLRSGMGQLIPGYIDTLLETRH